MKNIFFIISLLSFFNFNFTFTSSTAAVAKDTLKKCLLQNFTLDPIINEIVTYKPVDNHHFNLAAPQSCGPKATLIQSSRVMTCQFHDSGLHSIILSLCDNKNTYCKNERISMNVRSQLSKSPRIQLPPQESTLIMQSKIKSKLLSDFKVMTPEQVKIAIKDKKAALVMISTDWCPPCNVVKEFLIPTEDFKNKTKDLLLIYVDGDSPEAKNWAPYLKSYFYPTFVLLNKELESVALFNDITSVDYFKSLDKGLSLLNDSYAELESRIIRRLSESYFQKALDLFKTKESITNDQIRWIEYLEARGQIQEQIKYLKLFSKPEFYGRSLIAEYKLFMFNQQSIDLSPEDIEKRKKQVNLAILNSKLSKLKDDEIYILVLDDFCENQTDLNSKSVSDISPDCFKYTNNYIEHLMAAQTSSKKNHNLLESERILSQANHYLKLAQLHQKINQSTEAKNNFSLCFDEYEKLYVFSPLKEKSRSVRFQQLYCLKDLDKSNKSLDVLNSLAKDYPFEETFQRKLSSYYYDKKDFKKALTYNEVALKYSYGILWAMNMSTKAKILEALNRKPEAIEVVDEALKEIVLDKESKALKVVSQLRSQKEALKLN